MRGTNDQILSYGKFGVSVVEVQTILPAEHTHDRPVPTAVEKGGV